MPPSLSMFVSKVRVLMCHKGKHYSFTAELCQCEHFYPVLNEMHTWQTRIKGNLRPEMDPALVFLIIDYHGMHLEMQTASVD